MRWSGTQRRSIRPTEEGVADLMDEEDFEEGAAEGPHLHRPTLPSRRVPPGLPATPLSAVTESAMYYEKVAHREKRNRGAPPHTDGENSEAVEEPSSAAAYTAAITEGTRKSSRSDFVSAGCPAIACSTATEGIAEELHREDEQADAYILERQQFFYEVPSQQLVDVVCAYLRSTENVALVSPQEEHILFPVLMERLQELHVSQMLDIVECHWCRSTMLRYGLVFKDAVRDRIAQLATAAAAQLERKQQQAQSKQQQPGSDAAASGSGDADSGFDGRAHETTSTAASESFDHAGEEDDGAIFVDEKMAADAQRAADAVLAHAEREITAETIYRALVVMGMSAGRRKRDLAFFQLLGSYFTFYINAYRDPHQLVRVLTALARAKILPAPAFLRMMARRLPVLHKRIPLEPLPAYRALSNFCRMGHTSMNTFRFLADCMCVYMDKNIQEEKKWLRKQQTVPKAVEAVPESSTNGGTPSDELTTTTATAAATSTTQMTPPMMHLQLSRNFSPAVVAKERLRHLCGLKPSMFTRWLFILARFSAPHQQYLRPLVKPIILPMLPYFPPPSFTRLLNATSRFQSTDKSLVDAFTAHICDVLAPAGELTRIDTLAMLRLVSQVDTPVPDQLDRLLQICKTTLGSATTAASAASTSEDGVTEHNRERRVGTVTVVLRPNDMCAVVQRIGALQRRVDIPLESLSPLIELVEDFARRLAFLMDLGVVTLSQIDEFLEHCDRCQIPDTSGAIEQLSVKRRDGVEKRHERSSVESDNATTSSDDVEDVYCGELDIDVREMFHRIRLANEWNTYGDYRPLPGPLQVDFRDELTKVSAFELLQAVDLYEQASPGTLRDAPRRFISRSLLEKLGQEGEVVVEEETNLLVIREPRAELLTRDDLQTFLELLQRTPLKTVQRSPVVWRFVQEKAERLGVTAIRSVAAERLQSLHEMNAR